MRFTDRADAGRQMGTRLRELGLERPVVYALPRGGVPVAIEIAKALGAPLDLLLVRKIGAPGAPELAIGAVAEGAPPGTVRNPDIMAHAGADEAFFTRAKQHELREMERRRALYLEGRERISPAGRAAIVVDDGLATGATAKAALDALRRQGAAETVLAVPVAPLDTLAEMATHADHIVCLHPARRFHGVGSFYDDFHQLTDEETVGLLREAWAGEVQPPDPAAALFRREVAIPPHGLGADLCLPPNARGIVLFAHGSGSSRFSPRNAAVARRLNMLGFATLLLDLLTPQEAHDRRNVFDIPLLAERLVEANAWILGEAELAELPLGLFGASTGAGAALLAAAELGPRVAATVSRGGRPDLAGPRLAEVRAPTLLIVGGEDHQVLALNRKALAMLTCEKLLRLVPGATHVFDEPGALEQVTEMAGEWFQHYLPPPSRPSIAPAGPPTSAAPVEALRAAAEPLAQIDDPAFAAAIDRFADCRVVLLGEASHGTSEFYRARAAFTRRLVERHGFSIVAAEADWPDAATIDRYIRHAPRRPLQGPPPFTRFPTWMWRNTEMHDFIAQLRALNAERQPEERVGFYGLDLYNMTAAMAAVLAYLDRVDPETARVARARYACLSPWSREPAAYGRAAISRGYALCEEPVTRMLLDLLQRERRYAAQDGAAFLDAAQNARLIADAERYYRIMYYGSHESWNLRDNHMFDTLCHVLDWAGPRRKAVVWAHNSHIGDARFTEMGERGELNLGQLCRQRFGAQAALIGFGTHAGTVAAASEWDAPMEIKSVRPSRPDSYEAWCHATGHERFLLDLRGGRRETLRPDLAGPRLERYIGVIYRPETERWSHYAASELLDQYDAFVWFDQTRAVTPLPARVMAGEDDSYPFGL